ncbi:MAG: hypothetical protein NTW54_00680 [Bacteroidetes bacterium]|nr:hypothetical protein [Bacteroidota bacterium]
MKAENTITHSNYEALMVDYWDGTLSPAMKAMLILFLNENPQIREDIMEAGQFTLPTELLYFENKEELFKKEVSHSNMDSFLVAELEHDLLPHEQNELNLFIAAHPHYKSDRALYALTKVRPNKNLIYPNKGSLKHGPQISLWLRYSRVAAAACVLLAFGLWWVNKPKMDHDYVDNSNFKSQLLEMNSDRLTSATPPLNSTVKASDKQEHLVQKRYNALVSSASSEMSNALLIPVHEAGTENFNSYSRNRNPDDYLEALVNTYLPSQKSILPVVNQEGKSNIAEPNVHPPTTSIINDFASKSLNKLLKDSTLADEIGNQKYSVKTRVAKTVAWVTAKASKGKLRAEAIPNLDGSLAAMSFTNGKYNYTKRF